MGYKFFMATRDEEYGYKDYGIVQRNFMRENVDTLIRYPLDNRQIFIYKKTNYGISNLIDGEQPRFFIYLGDEVSEILHQISLLEKIYNHDDLIIQMQHYPHIAHLTGNSGWYCDSEKYFGEFKKRANHYLRYIDYDYSIRISNDYEGKFFIFGGSVTSINDTVNAFVKYADNLFYELKHFNLDLGKLRHNESYAKYKSSPFNYKLKRVIAIGGLFAAKAVLKSIGADLNTSFNFDIPDTNIDFSQIDSFDFDCDFDCDFDYTPESYANTDGQFNISFGANKTIGDNVYLDKGYTITLEPAGGGLGEEKPTVYVESGTNTRYILDGNTPRKIDGVNQILYHGKKWTIGK